MTKHLSQDMIRSMDRAAALIERQKPESKQPRFDPKTKPNNFFWNIYSWAKEAIFNEPKYKPDSRVRDKWLREIAVKEPYLLGILNSVISIDKNRGWTLSGGRNQVKKFTDILHNFQSAPDVMGWRSGMAVSADSFYCSDLGAVIEVGRSQKRGPLAGLYTMDSTRCYLTGDYEYPLKYSPGTGGDQNWTNNDYFRVASRVSSNESFNGLGYCALSRCLELSKLAVSIFEHDREKLASKAPKGILQINGNISQQQWLDSLKESKAELETLQREYYAGVQTLVGTDVDIKLIPLSDLPEGFDHKVFMDTIIFGYALAFGYDPREFWPVSGGSLGTGRETETQHKKANQKGGMDFILGIQEKIQDELPDTVDFEFEERDIDTDKAESELKLLNEQVINQMFSVVNAAGESEITRDEARNLLAEAKLIPEAWAIADEETEVTDTEDVGRMMERSRVKKALDKFGETEDIVQYSWPLDKVRTIRPARTRSIFRAKPKVLYDKDGVKITQADVDAAINGAASRVSDQYKALLKA